MNHKILAVAGSLVVFGGAGAANATTYTSDTNIANFTAGVSSYATFSNYGAGDVPPGTFTPTAAELATQGLRIYSGGTHTGLPGGNWLLATFGGPTAEIRVFPNMDHFGAAYDGYQYSIYGSLDGTTWTALYDPTSVIGSGEPFTLGTFSGTAPTSVDNVGTPGNGPGGVVGYIADFNFGQAYTYYAFGASTEATHSGNADQELSGVGDITSVPEPATLSLLALGLLGASFARRRKA